MVLRDRLLALLVAVLWGVNFPATRFALDHFPPFLLVCLRFLLLAIPTIIFVPRPKVALRWLLAYGAGFGILQFAFLYLGMNAGMPSGLASLVLQASAPFTVVLAGIFLRERLTPLQGVGIGLAIAGLGLIAARQAQVSSLLPLILTLCGALGWALGNLASRQARPPEPLRFALWMSVVPPLPMLALSLLIEGPERVRTSIATAFTLQALPAVLGLLYIVVFATVLGSGIWTTLLSRYPSSTVAPFSLLVPIVGMSSSAVIFRERLDGVELVGAAVVVGGVLLGSLRLGRRAKPADS